MKHFTRHNGELYAEGVPLKFIAEQVGTPCYIYSKAAITEAWQAFNEGLTAFDTDDSDGTAIISTAQINYAVKANSNLSILKLLAGLGSGFDIVSQGELERVLQAGGKPEKIFFSGVGKSYPEIKRALEISVGCINVESKAELYRIQDIAKALNLNARIALRINPDVDPDSHPYISTGLKENKFGIPMELAKDLFQEAASLNNILIKGIAFHIGSQVTSVLPFQSALKKILQLIDDLKDENIVVQDLDVGGGLGVKYQDETPPTPREYIESIMTTIKEHNAERHSSNKNTKSSTKQSSTKPESGQLKLHFEPGRAIVANAGLLLTKVEYIKEKGRSNQHHDHKPHSHYFAIVDAAMNDLLRPTLYSVWHDIVPVANHLSYSNGSDLLFDIVEPSVKQEIF